MDRPAFLVGLMGSGKSAVAHALATAHRVPVCDLDARTVRMFGRSIAALFERGEAEFRRCERLALASLCHEPGFEQRRVVVATGGGAVIDPRNRATMAIGTVVFLDVPLVELARRLQADVDSVRPLAAGQSIEAVLVRQWAEREAFYRDGSLAVDGTGEPIAVAERVARAAGWGA